MPAVILLKSQTKIFVWLLLLWPFFTLTAEAQKYFFDKYGVEQGLSEQKVYTLLQDSKDYIWLGTANGVSRFDGKKFENFTTLDSLASGGVWCMLEDSLGYIWFGHLYGGISRYNGHQFERAGFDSIKVSSGITSISAVNDKLWFTTEKDGAIQVDFPVDDLKNMKGKQYTGKNGLSDQVLGSAVLSDNSLICIADAGMRRFNIEDKKFENYRMPHMTTYFQVTCLLQDKKGNIWFGTQYGGIYKYVLSESRMEFIDLPKAGLPSNWITCLAEDRKGRMWIGTWEGGVALVENGNVRKFNKTNGLEATRIYDIIEDIEGNILIADQNNGLSIYKGEAFLTISGEEGLPDPNVNTIIEDKSGDLWIGTNAGILHYFPWTDKEPVLYENTYNPRFFRKDKDDNIWIGTDGNGVMLYNTRTLRFEPQTYINSKLHHGLQVTSLEIDKKNNLWIGGVQGLTVGTINKENFNRYTLMDSLTVNSINTLYCDPSDNVWIGTDDRGLIRFNASDESFEAITALPGIKAKSMVMDGNSVLWIGTGEGVHAFKNDSVIATLTTDDGLLSNNINLLATGNDGSIYIGTNKGLNRYFPESKRVFSYTEKNGFTGIEIKPNAVYKNREGGLWFGTANGATLLRPEMTSTMEMEPLTHLSDMRVNNQERKMTPGLKLKYTERSIVFDYYSICLTNPDVVKYKFKLEGADIDWQPVTDQTRAAYPALTSGKYSFMVVACNSLGIWNKDPVSFSFTIKPPFYLTWWFILTAIIIIIAGIIIYIRTREQHLVKEKVILEEKVKERTAEVVQKGKEIEEKNRDITASIRYAERIQRAMLPREDIFTETFVLFMPKDIVSGDFYWMFENGTHQFIAVCDCTGHGVPGAFMSIIGHNSLHKVVREYGVTRPSEILDQLNTEVLKALAQRNEEIINDGMDMGLIVFDKKNFSVEFAGAYNPLYVVRNGEVIVYKGDRFPIGMTAIDEKKNFSNQKVEIQAGDMLYLSSDGYADQFGSAKVKKYKSGNVKKLLSEIWHLPVDQQRDILKKETLEWRGDLEQVDDILFVGKKIILN